MKEEQDKNKQAKSASDSSKKQEDSIRADVERHDRADVRQPVSPSAWKRLLAKRWVFPAIYLAAAAIILSLMWAYQGNNDSQLTEEGPELSTDQPTDSIVTEDDAWPVTGMAEDLEWPVSHPEEMEVIRPFYDENAPAETKQAAMIHYENTYTPSTGIDLVRTNDETFDVLAALSGTVTRVDDAPLVGNVVEIEHEDGLKTIYYSLANVAVEEGSLVVQGEVIAQSGRSEIGSEFGEHLHFEVHKNNEPMNPLHFLPVVTEAQAPGSTRDADASMNEDMEVDANVDSSIDMDVNADAETGVDVDANAEDANMDAGAAMNEDSAVEIDTLPAQGEDSVTDAVTGTHEHDHEHDHTLDAEDEENTEMDGSMTDSE